MQETTQEMVQGAGLPFLGPRRTMSWGDSSRRQWSGCGRPTKWTTGGVQSTTPPTTIPTRIITQGPKMIRVMTRCPEVCRLLGPPLSRTRLSCLKRLPIPGSMFPVKLFMCTPTMGPTRPPPSPVTSLICAASASSKTCSLITGARATTTASSRCGRYATPPGPSRCGPASTRPDPAHAATAPSRGRARVTARRRKRAINTTAGPAGGSCAGRVLRTGCPSRTLGSGRRSAPATGATTTFSFGRAASRIWRRAT
mmetsp:Transcript_30664/g.60707  ORF Transcript_30664/g.60707 Transcript_30664/m.60707 type:complete len:254 (+) Transcript_30664:580-1341(+)